MIRHVFTFASNAYLVDPNEIYFAEIDFKKAEIVSCFGENVGYHKHDKHYLFAGPAAAFWSDLEKRAETSSNIVLIANGSRGYFADSRVIKAFTHSTRMVDYIREYGRPERKAKNADEMVTRLFCSPKSSILAPGILFDALKVTFAQTRKAGTFIGLAEEDKQCVVDLSAAKRIDLAKGTLNVLLSGDRAHSFRFDAASSDEVARAVAAFVRKHGLILDAENDPKSPWRSYVDPKAIWEVKTQSIGTDPSARVIFRDGSRRITGSTDPKVMRRLLDKAVSHSGLTRILGGAAPVAIRLHEAATISIAREDRGDRHHRLYLRIDGEAFDILPEEVAPIAAIIRVHGGFSFAKLGAETMTWLSTAVRRASIDLNPNGRASLYPSRGPHSRPLGSHEQAKAFLARHLAGIEDAIQFETERSIGYLRTSFVKGVYLHACGDKKDMSSLTITCGAAGGDYLTMPTRKAAALFKKLAKRAGLTLVTDNLALHPEAVAAISMYGPHGPYGPQSEITMRGDDRASWRTDLDAASFLVKLGFSLPAEPATAAAA